METTHQVIAIVGPTATGKSALGLRLAETLGGEIINADALQVYRGFDVGTGKPSLEERRRIPHHLIDILEPHERYSAGEFARRAREAIAEIQGRGRVPIVVGGSGLYLRALLEGISPIPPPDPRMRRELHDRLEREGLEALRRELEELDSETAARLSPGDTQRTLRALEVALMTGRPLSSWIARQPFGTRRMSAIRIGLTLPRPILYHRIATRVRRMVQRGWVEEVIQLLQHGLDPSLPAFQAIGYRQLVRHVRQGWSLDLALEDTIRATRHFAKRQETWFRKEPHVVWFDAQGPGGRFPQILEHLGRSGLGRAHG